MPLGISPELIVFIPLVYGMILDGAEAPKDQAAREKQGRFLRYSWSLL